jgi:hypothetical protein
MITRVLGAPPIQRINDLTRHLPPAVSNVLSAHAGNFAGPLPRQQDGLECVAANQAKFVEPVPQQSKLFVANDATAAVGLATLDAGEWVGLYQLLFRLDAPIEDGATQGLM